MCIRDRFKEAAARLEAVQQQIAAAEREVAELERLRDALKGTVRLLKEADKVNAPDVYKRQVPVDKKCPLPYSNPFRGT